MVSGIFLCLQSYFPFSFRRLKVEKEKGSRMGIWKKIIFLTFITAGMFLFSMSSVMAEETADDEDPLSVEAPSAILVEASTGEILYEKNADEQRSPASITKIMTLLLI